MSVINSLNSYGLTPAKFFERLLTIRETSPAVTARREFLAALPQLLQHVKTNPALEEWAFEIVQEKFRREMLALREKSAGLHGLPKHTKAKDLRSFDPSTIVFKARSRAPWLVNLISTLLRVTEGRKQRSLTMERLAAIIGIMVYTSNCRANAFQTSIGVFMHACQVPVRVLGLLHRLGIIISERSIARSLNSAGKDIAQELKVICSSTPMAVAFDNFNLNYNVREPTLISSSTFSNLSSAIVLELYGYTEEAVTKRQQLYDMRQSSQWKMPTYWSLFKAPSLFDDELSRGGRVFRALQWHITRILAEGIHEFKYLADQLGDSPGKVFQIPLHTTRYWSIRAMPFDESKTEGVACVLDEVDRQRGFDHKNDRIQLYHGDLATLERMAGLRQARAQEEQDLRTKCHFTEDIPRAFHMKMAAADSIHRIHLDAKGSHLATGGAYEWARILRDHDYGRVVNTIWAETKPTYDKVREFSERISHKYVFMGKKKATEDAIFDNQCILLRDLLFYTELCHSMNTGDVGRLEDILPTWIFIWKGTRKHKYATYLHRFLYDLEYNYPPDLAQLIRLNWLVNPTGKPFAFRGVDWVVELINLYIKVVFGSDSSTKSVETILQGSQFIDLYKDIFAMFDNKFWTMHRTYHHSPPNIGSLLQKLQGVMRDKEVHIEKARQGDFRVIDAVWVGLEKLKRMTNDASGGVQEEVVDTRRVADEENNEGNDTVVEGSMERDLVEVYATLSVDLY
ncbi:15485_t:CDS:2 [Acaulospora colombiana]|uniref:15485_t:CDS:1 n=1 Tax=Acaulospora colombiana TaxID=27376 RepID=A0ACA9LCW9_9GLOM|nr:15485_t:CDS:2 [Acaulospora colombiana]